MKIEDEVRLSFYKEIANVDERHGVVLVQHSDTGKVYVKKTLDRYDREVYEVIRDRRFSGIPVIKELIDTDDGLVVIEDYVSGQSLDEQLEKKLFSEAETAAIITELCDILAPLHSHRPSIIHRDIKGANVITGNDGKIYLIDFDASKKVLLGRNRDTDLIGTVEYAAPEQYGFGQSDQRTDIYSLGILMNRLLTGRFPSEEKYHGDLAGIIAKATSLDPANRYRDVGEMRAAFKAAGYEVKTADREMSKTPRFLRYIKELPGFRSGDPAHVILAIMWYAAMIGCGYFATANAADYTPAQCRFYSVTTFLELFVPTLYLGNYLGVRDRLPWPRSDRKSYEFIRIALGAVASFLITLFLLIIVAYILHY